MNHDPLCPVYVYGKCPCHDNCPVLRCECALIAKVRADEREQAAQRVAALPHWEDGWPENVVINRAPAIAAIREDES